MNKNLLEFMVKSIASKPDEVEITEFEEGAFTVLKVIANEEDYGKIIGKNGKVAQSLRSIVRTANKDRDKRYLVKIGQSED